MFKVPFGEITMLPEINVLSADSNADETIVASTSSRKF